MKKDIHIFSPGTQTSAQGVTREFTKKDLRQVAESYDPNIHEAPIRIGHTDTDKVPAWGWVKKVKMKGDDLYAEVEFSPLMEDYVKNGLYKKVSASFYSPESKINPEPGNWSLRHVAMLGAQPPAVKGLKGFAYSEISEEDGVLDFAVKTKLNPDSVFDEELGPTLKSEQNPIEALKEKLDEARSEMAKEETQKAELEAQAENQQPEAEQAEFAEKMKKAPKGKMGAEDADEEISEDDSEDMASSCGSKKYKEGCDSKKYMEPALKKKVTGAKSEAVEDGEEMYEEATALRQGKSTKVGAPMHDKKMVDSPDEETDGPGPVVKKQSKKYRHGDAMQDPNLDEYMPEQKQQYAEGRAYKDVTEGEAMQDMQKGKFRKEQNMQYEEDTAQHTEGPKKRMDSVKKVKPHGEAMQDPRKGDYRPGQEEQYEERAKDYKHGDAMQDPNEGKLNSDMPKSIKKTVYKEGCSKNYSSRKMNYSEVEVPAGMDVEEYREGFIQAVVAYEEALLIGGDVEFTEDDEVTPSFKAGVEAGLSFAESEVIRQGKPTGVGAAMHDKKMVASPDEETDIPGKDTHPDTPRMPNSGKNELDDVGEYQEPTFDPRGPKGATKKRGSDGMNSSDTGVKQAGKSDMRYKEMEGKDLPEPLKKQAAKMKAKGGKMSMEQAMKEDEAMHKEVFKDLPDGDDESKDSRPGEPGNVKPGRPDSKDYKSKTKVKATKTLIHGEDGMDRRPSSRDLGRQNDQSGRGETGEAGEEGKTFRARGGDSPRDEAQGTDYARMQKGTDGGAQENDRMRNIGKSKELSEERMVTGKPEPQNIDDRARAMTLGGYPGTGAAVKKPQVRVMHVGKKGGTKQMVTNFAESEQFSELNARLAELEAANAKLVQEKIAAERAAHRAQLVEFTESLYNTGRLTPAVVDADELVDYMEGLEYGTLEFSEGETAATKLMEILAALPSQVSFSEVAAFNKDEIPMENLDPHERALRLSKEEGMDYSEALKKTLFTAE